MALDNLELIRVKGQLVPLLVPELRRMRAGGAADPVGTMKTKYQTLNPTGKMQLMADLGFGLVESAISLDPGDFNACVDVAALQL